MTTPISAVQGQNAHKGVKRGLVGNPLGVPKQLPGFRGRVVDAGGPVKAPKLRNGNLNNSTSNVRIPYSRVCPLQFLSSYQGRLGPGDVIFTHKYPPGFVASRPTANNMTLGVNTLSRVVGLDGLNRLLMQSGPNGWREGENVLIATPGKGAWSVLDTNGAFTLSVLKEYHLDGVVISNDEPGAFTSSGSRDNALFNVAIQGPVETNNGYLKYESEDPASREYTMYNPLTGVINSRTVEAHARGSSESGMHIDSTTMPGRVGSAHALSRGKVDFVANFCGTYATFPSQMFDRRVEIMNTLYLGLRAYELSYEAKRQLTDEKGDLKYGNEDDEYVRMQKCYFYQYLPFSSRAAAVIQQVTNTHVAALTKKAIEGGNMPTPETLSAMMRQDAENGGAGRKEAAKLVKAVKQQTETSMPSAAFDTATYDPIRSEDLWSMVGAWSVGRVMDTKASVHDRYAGGPRDAAFSCMVDVGVSWRAAGRLPGDDRDRSFKSGHLLPASARGGQQSEECLANNHAPPLESVIGPDFGKSVRGSRSPYEDALQAIDQALFEQAKKEAADPSNTKAANMLAATQAIRAKLKSNYPLVKEMIDSEKVMQDLNHSPMEFIRTNVFPGVELDDSVKQATLTAWRALQEAKASKKPKNYKDKRQAKFKEAAKDETRALVRAYVDADMANPNQGGRKAAIEAITSTVRMTTKQLDDFIKDLRAMKMVKGTGEAQNYFLQRAQLYLEILLVIVKPPATNTTGTSLDEVDVESLYHEIVHLSTIVDMYHHHFASSEGSAVSSGASVSAVAAPAPAPATPIATPIATPAPVVPIATPMEEPAPVAKASTKAPAKRGKTPQRARPATTGAATSSTPAPATVPVPAAASSMTSTPMVPTAASISGAGEAPAPRRRARETGESVTNSLFENMFKSAPTDAADEEPASPTPSSGSEGPTSGPRTFRRQR